jgi:hypothetical protein
MNSSYIRMERFICVILDRKESKIQKNWKKCYIVELVVGFFEDVYSVRF